LDFYSFGISFFSLNRQSGVTIRDDRGCCTTLPGQKGSGTLLIEKGPKLSMKTHYFKVVIMMNDDAAWGLMKEIRNSVYGDL